MDHQLQQLPGLGLELVALGLARLMRGALRILLLGYRRGVGFRSSMMSLARTVAASRTSGWAGTM